MNDAAAQQEQKTERRKKVFDREELDQKPALSPEEAAWVIGCGRTQIYKILTRDKVIPSYYIGRSLRVRRTDVDAYVRERLAENQG